MEAGMQSGDSLHGIVFCLHSFQLSGSILRNFHSSEPIERCSIRGIGLPWYSPQEVFPLQYIVSVVSDSKDWSRSYPKSWHFHIPYCSGGLARRSVISQIHNLLVCQPSDYWHPQPLSWSFQYSILWYCSRAGPYLSSTDFAFCTAPTFWALPCFCAGK